MSGTGTAPRPNNFSENLMMARLAVKYVKDNMPLGAANKGVGNFLSNTFGLWNTEVGECLTAVRESLDAYKESSERSNFEIIRSNANRALLGGCGNCDEQAMAAFMFLYNNRVRPLDLMVCPNVHVFVVLGRDGKSVSNRVGTWGFNAAICDPWDDSSYVALLRPLKMSSVSHGEMTKTFSAFRAD